ncbi:PTS galactitol transporter subunit IIBC [Candidatus Mcinerneyibacteriota bacterium]|nr:PTS galactitol transporter subunit IIBC [Candidatus Mcinerneyibacteriota bacterium]
MTVALVMTHGDLGESLISTAEMIVGKMDGIFVLGFQPEDSIDLYREKVKSFITEHSGDDIFLFTDIFGGSCANTAMRHMESPRVWAFAGVNLPMLIAFHTLKLTLQPDAIGDMIGKEGVRSVVDMKSEWKGRREG